jgi:hypothetical protein
MSIRQKLYLQAYIAKINTAHRIEFQLIHARKVGDQREATRLQRAANRIRQQARVQLRAA